MPDRDPALAKFAWLQLVRVACIAVVLVGVLFYVGRIGGAPELGAVLLIAGAAGFFLVPRMLARRWKSPEE